MDPSNQPDTDGDGLNDGIDLDDNDGFTDAQEEAAGSDPLDSNSIPEDRDNDGLTDVEEASYFDLIIQILMVMELVIRRSPLNPNTELDTDGDGIDTLDLMMITMG